LHSSADAAPVEVMVQGTISEAKRLQDSAEAVSVVDLSEARQQTADLGEVLARTQGIVVRRSGGLGSESTLSLNGLDGDQIRYFLDGVPLELSGYPFGATNVPVNLTERIEVYRGVVPIRFGADALGGAINLVTDQRYTSRASASYQVGSYGVHRATLAGRHRDDPTGLVVGGAAFLDVAENDYEVDVEIPDKRGRLSPATVERFHDGYLAAGGTLEAGVVDRPWAKRLLLRGFVSSYDKELQHNAVMTVPYGEVRYDESVFGGTAQYLVDLLPNLELDVVGAYTHRYTDFVDTSKWVYSWTGEQIRERRVGGELDSRPSDTTIWQNGGFGRVMLGWSIRPEHAVRLAVSPNYTTRTGDERLQADPESRDPLTARRRLFTLVSGLEYEIKLFDDRFANIVFVKDYLYKADTEESLTGGIFRERKKDSHTFGAGDSLRYKFSPWFLVKASYEYATRLPRPDEVFGDGVLILSNLELEPEVSHNANFGPRFELQKTSIGDLTVDVNAFYRDSDRLIVLLGNDRNFTWQNVYEALGIGLENAVAWSSPGQYVGVDGTFTWQEVRNSSDQGTFADFEGDRLPNRPYLSASWGARGRIANMPGREDTLEPFYDGRWVQEFFRGWESQGLREFKQVVASQMTHSIGITWTWHADFAAITTTFEIDNLLDDAAFDHFGVQRPGRAFYLKVMGELR
jgi:vitamin B12 transporter